MEKIKKESLSKPRWSVNDEYLFLSIESVLKSGVQMSKTTVDQATLKLKPAVLQQILTKLNDLKSGPAIDRKQLSSRNDHKIFAD